MSYLTSMQTDAGLRAAGASRRGGVLVLTLVVVLVVGAMAGAFLQLNSAATRRQALAVDNKLAFYVSEAGLTQGYLALMSGSSGAIGEEVEPASFADGFVWVEAEDLGSGYTRLISHGYSNKGKVQLAAVFERPDPSPAMYGMFSNQDLVLPQGSFVDGYDSDLGPPSGGSGGWSGAEFSSSETPDATSIGRIGSNGSIDVLSSERMPSRIYADLESGPSQSIIVLDSAEFLGEENQLAEELVLPPVTLPAIAQGEALRLLPGTKAIIDPGRFGYGDVSVGSNTILHLTGPLELLVDSLSLESDGELVIDDRAGAVRLFVRNGVTFNVDSTLTQLGNTADSFELLVAGVTTSALDATAELAGLIYAPNATLQVGSDFQVSGALVADLLLFTGSATLHYDHHLVNEAKEDLLPKMVSWRIDEMKGMSTDELIAYGSVHVTSPDLADAVTGELVTMDYIGADGTLKTYSGELREFTEWGDVQGIKSLTKGGIEADQARIQSLEAYSDLIKKEFEKGKVELVGTLYDVETKEEALDAEKRAAYAAEEAARAEAEAGAAERAISVSDIDWFNVQDTFNWGVTPDPWNWNDLPPNFDWNNLPEAYELGDIPPDIDFYNLPPGFSPPLK